MLVEVVPATGHSGPVGAERTTGPASPEPPPGDADGGRPDREGQPPVPPEGDPAPDPQDGPEVAPGAPPADAPERGHGPGDAVAAPDDGPDPPPEEADDPGADPVASPPDGGGRQPRVVRVHVEVREGRVVITVEVSGQPPVVLQPVEAPPADGSTEPPAPSATVDVLLAQPLPGPRTVEPLPSCDGVPGAAASRSEGSATCASPSSGTPAAG